MPPDKAHTSAGPDAPEPDPQSHGSTARGMGPVRRPFALGTRAPKRAHEAPKVKILPAKRSASRSGGWGRIAEESDDEFDQQQLQQQEQQPAPPQDDPAEESGEAALSGGSADVTITDVDSAISNVAAVEPHPRAIRHTPPGGLRDTSIGSDSANATQAGERVGSASHHGLTVIRPRQVGRYNLVEVLGRGGLGVIHLAHDDSLRRDLAIKVLRHPTNPKHRESFVEEAQITGQLEHPNVVPVHELGFDEHGSPYLAMKRVKGHSLRELIEKQKRRHRAPMQSELVRQLDIFRKVCNAIAFAHDHGVIHRDLKPENIMVGEYGEVMVMDWGLAKPLRDGHGYRSSAHGGGGSRTAVRSVETVHTDRRDHKGLHLTAMGQLMGTPAYMAPEQARGESGEVDRRTDIFALGGLLYHMLTGEPPYLGTGLSEVLIQASQADVIPPRKRAPQMQIPKELDAVVMKAMAREPRSRYRSVSDMRDDIDAYLSNEPLRAYHDTWFESLTKWSRRHPTQTTVVGMGVLLVAVLLIAVFAWREARVAADERERRHELLQAQADARLAEARRSEAEIRERVAAEAAQRARLEADAEEARIRNLAQQGQIELLLRDLVGEGASESDLRIHQFRVRVGSARTLGMDERQVVANLEDDQFQLYLDAFEHAFEEEPDKANPEARFLYALLLAYGPESRIAEACLVLDDVLDEEPNEARYLYIRGRLHAKLGDDAEAESDWRHAVRLEPGMIDAHMALARLSLDARRWWEAAERYGRAVDIERDRIAALAGRGFALIQLGQTRGGYALLTRAEELGPQTHEVNLYRAVLLYQAGEYESALPRATAAITLRPDEPWAYLVRGRILQAQGSLNRALADFGNAVRLDPYRPRTVFARAQLYLQRGEFENALADLNETIARDDKHAEAYRHRAHLHANAHAWSEARQDAQRATYLAPQDWQAWLVLAEIEAQSGNEEEARNAYQKAQEHAETPQQQEAIRTSQAEHLDNED